MSNRGMLIVLSGPSGVGKGTVRQAMLEDEFRDFHYSVSMTTRKPRPGEQDGVDYYFVSKEEFEQEIANDGMLEYAQYVDNYYGTPMKYVNQTLDSGRDVLLEIEVQGAMQVREKCPDGVFIFLTPPDLLELRNRIQKRGTDDQATIDKRMQKAADEIKMMENYDYAVVNDEIPNAVQRIEKIIESEHLRVPRVIDQYKKMIGE
ncbi:MULTISPECIES: guanylate kinase [Latilactobacillus]|uniref:Guanylate kinase n=2 Tax=Latilactobacillus curvatus TaxID=28038 RepID=A0A1B2A7Y5_LATCU|nr:guanylate kinase [Latilactobacillus curvatus]ANJ69095.1 guanylate kinase [Latilactobacillus curvatus]ANY14112.1 guanylate kinase [Latilactobacillus curvatus]AOO75773.1 guanylate kinase [Latilactobacillus curvatus]ASN60412.1 guanylate kinase [Latilactobacillus curvatus]ASN62346.1 guanylate kinase [Latilactobacillus curvatus]